MSEQIVLDPVEFAEDRAELSLAALGLEVRQEGADWGESQVEVQLSRQAIGAQVTDRHLEPVEMTIPIRVREEGSTSLAEAAYKLQQKVGLFQQESGGWIRRDFATDGGFAGSVGYQVLKASLSGLQGWLFAHRENAPDATLKILRSPLCYATEEVESAIFSETSARQLEWELAEVLGTAPGLIRVRVTNDNASADWRGLISDIETRDHPQDASAETTASLAYLAEDLTPKGGATVTGGVVEHASLTAGWLTILDSEIDGVGHMTHKGVRRPWIRAEDTGDEAGDVEFKLRWRALGSLQWSENSIVRPLVVDAYQLLDMGECRPEAAALGDERWQFQVQARAPGGSGKARIKDVYVRSVEQAAVLKAPEVPASPDLQSQKSTGTGVNDASVGTEAWSNPGNITSSNDARATTGGTGENESNYLKATNFGFAIPEEARIAGVVLEVERSASSASKVIDKSIRLTVEGSYVGDNQGAGFWPASDAFTTYGGSTDLWGTTTLTPAQVNAATFGVGIAVLAPTAQARVDFVRMIVYYTEETDENRVCFAGRSIELRTDGVYRQHPEDEVWGQVMPEGFLPYASPSGLEARTSRGIIIPSQGDLEGLADSGSNKLSVQVFYRPAYLFSSEAGS